VHAAPYNDGCYINKMNASPNTTKSSASISAKRKPLPLMPAKSLTLENGRKVSGAYARGTNPLAGRQLRRAAR